jgi:hypothetical protein
MKAITTLVLAAALLSARPAVAQTKTLVGETVTATATIEAIEAKSRTLTIKNQDGTYESMIVPAEVTRFPQLKVGDKITVRYYDNVVLRLKKEGQPAVDVQHDTLTPGSGAKPGATAASQRTITATITAIDPKIPSITLKGPNGWTYSRKVDDKKALAQVKVGDKLDITWTEALLISVEPAK